MNTEITQSEHSELAQVAPEIIPGKYGGYLKPIRSSERAREVVKKRWDRARAQAAAAVEEEGGWKAIVKARAKHAQTEKAGAAASAAFVGRAADLMPGREGRTVDAGNGGPGITLTLSESAAGRLLELLAKRQGD